MATGTGTLTGGGSKITGTGTAFTTQLQVGDYISVGGSVDEHRQVTGVESNTVLFVDQSFGSALSTDNFTFHRGVSFNNVISGQWVNDGASDIWMLIRSDGNTIFLSAPNGYLVDPAGGLIPHVT